MRTPLMVFSLMALSAAGASAQQPPRASVEAHAGYGSFFDEEPIGHSIVGAAGRIYVTRRLAVGPEVTYMRGPGTDRDLSLTGNLTFDFVPPRATGEPRRAVPYILAGGGLMRHSDRFFNETFSSTEGAFTAGLGVRINLSDRFYIAPEARLGWEMHSRVGVTIGWRP
jgi:hypothetical protein